MEILPLSALHDEDTPLVGIQLVNLSKLKTWKFPVPGGMVVLAPEFHLQTALKHYNLTSRETFEQSLTIIKKDVMKIPMPAEFSKALSRRGKARELWQTLLEIWLQEIRSRIWQGGFSPNLTSGLSAQPVFFIDKIKYSGQSYYNPLSGEFDHLGDNLKLTLPQRELIEDSIVSANRRLYLPQVYHWLVDKSNKVWITKLVLYTHPLKKPEVFEAQLKRNPSKPAAPDVETITKVFLNISNTLVINKEADGFVINADAVIDAEDSQLKFDSQVFKVVETATSFPNLPVIFKFSDGRRENNPIRGALRLIHSPELVRREAEVVVFARDEKQLTNVSLGLPLSRSVHEFAELKRQLGSLGVSRRGTLKFWLEMAVPENLIHLADYLKSGLDGVILNVDELSACLGGFDPQVPEESFYAKEVGALTVFLTPGLKELHRANIEVVAKGDLVLHSEVMTFLIGQGVYGVEVNLANSYSLKEHLKFLEKRDLLKRVAQIKQDN